MVWGLSYESCTTTRGVMLLENYDAKGGPILRPLILFVNGLAIVRMIRRRGDA